MIIEKKITFGHAKVLIGLDNIELIIEKIINKRLSVRQTENLVKIVKNPNKIHNKKIDPNIRELENSLSNKVGLNVVIKNDKKNKGTITFTYKEMSQLNKIIEILKSYY